MLNALSNPNFELSNQFLGVILHIVENLFNCFAIEDLVDVVLAILNRHVHGVGIAKQVVHVSQYLLISANEENTQIIWFVFA